MPTAIITGISGQDGIFLARLLLQHGYQVHGTTRRALTDLSKWPEPLPRQVVLHQADMLDQSALARLVDAVRPCEIYNLAAQSFVPASWQDPITTAQVTALGVARLLEAVRIVDPSIRVFQAGSSEVFGAGSPEPQSEQTPFDPHTPYAAAKAYAHWLAVSYREQYGMFTCCGILFNHESPLRDPKFVTRKVSQAVAAIRSGRQQRLELGRMDGRRDWGFAGDFVRAMWLMLQQPRPGDYVIATGQTHTVKDLVETAFRHAGLQWQEHVDTDPSLVRPPERFVRRGDIGKARSELNWHPEVEFEQLIAMMVDADIERLNNSTTK